MDAKHRTFRELTLVFRQHLSRDLGFERQQRRGLHVRATQVATAGLATRICVEINVTWL
jgi:adenylylsulfate kinase-like enzyme